ncbi:cytochrome P450 714C2-like [Arachis duranensis]|uniref:Cytochrome P450 714C2-like n=1 Tax=Arachis duranensis TaxID=130453 RepID=A0A6P4BJK3_ARADU|nr:cytochrome P450 714C2-like [Arachis duranensis]
MMLMNIKGVVLAGLSLVLLHVVNELLLKPRSLRSKLQKQGIHGPSPHFYFGNIPEKKKILEQHQVHNVASSHQDKDKGVSSSISHRWYYNLFPHVEKWRRQYGPIYLFSSGSVEWLVVSDIEMVKEITLYTSVNLGKPSLQSRELGPLLGQGILSSSGPIWVHQRKIIAPSLYLDKVKEMVNLIVHSTNITLKSWESRLNNEGEALDLRIDDDLRSLSADIIARACFGINYVEGNEIFSKLRDLQNLLSAKDAGIPGFRCLPIKRNREIWRLEKEVNSMISKIIDERLKQDAEEQDLLQMILEGAKSCEGSDGILSDSISRDRFIIDNCKNIFFAGHESTAITASWCLMLLAIHQDWQDRVRAEVLQVCGNNPPDASMLRKMKMLTMVIQETMRLYPVAAFVSRSELEDIHLKGILIPKGMNIEISVPILMQDPEIWGHDSHEFNPERFSNGIVGACKFPQAYVPFGLGARICAGQHLAMTELKVILCLILNKFRISLSQSYCHSPIFRLVIEPGHGVILNITRI